MTIELPILPRTKFVVSHRPLSGLLSGQFLVLSTVLLDDVVRVSDIPTPFITPIPDPEAT